MVESGLKFQNLVDQFKNLGFIGVQQLVVTGPSGKYYEMKFDTGIRTLLYLVSDDFCVINLFVVDEFELGIDVSNIVHHSASYSIDLEAGTSYDSVNEALNSSFDDSSDDDFDLEELELIRLQNKKEITFKLEHFKIIYPGMYFKDTLKARMFMNLYALAENKGLVLLKSDKSRVRITEELTEPAARPRNHLHRLIDAIQTTLPEGKYMFCVKHIEHNWLKRWGGSKALKKKTWHCA
ncbi:hypothetical protein RND71_030213 [Anisodus tanguticus]|uniref:Uncharacterized protein n=1 Tax=Anisodus tanguticus TaxID=243964 RepID=A0AAE1REW0_9SOLA|nr:hypothetical protein RND71_030213 [Anisodus tanguticus]